MSRRCGIIAIQPKLMDMLLNAPQGAAYSFMDVPHDTIQAALRLPEGYTVIGTGHDFWRAVYLIVVAHADLPEVPDGTRAPELIPTYQLEAMGHVSILKIDVWAPPDSRPYHPATLPE